MPLNKSTVKKIVIAVISLVIIAAIAIWYVFIIKFTDTSETKADYTVNASDFIKEFEKNDSLANAKYTEKIIIVNGNISEVEAADTITNLKMVDSVSGSYLIFAFQKNNLDQVKAFKEGDQVSIKGSCSGGTFSKILEVEAISFKRCIINK